jgi:hypothetical protein
MNVRPHIRMDLADIIDRDLCLITSDSCSGTTSRILSPLVMTPPTEKAVSPRRAKQVTYRLHSSGSSEISSVYRFPLEANSLFVTFFKASGRRA